MERAFKYRFYPTPEQENLLRRTLGCVRLVYNRALAARTDSDAGWGELTCQLADKALWYGRTFVQIDRWFPSSKTCSQCGHKVDSLPLNVREWDCPQCNAHHNRDVNAAINHLAAGQAVLVCGATVRLEESKSRQAGAKKQKPKL